MNSEMIIRTASEADAPVLLEIYAPYVERTAITFEYEVPSVDEFASRIPQYLTEISLSRRRKRRPDPGIRLCRSFP